MAKKPAQSCDLRLNYAGAEFTLLPLSPVGQQWLDEAIEAPDQRGPAMRPLRHLDEVLRMAHRAGMRLDAPWDEADGPPM